MGLYLDIVLFWPDDGFLQPKHVPKILKYCQFADKYIYIYIYVVFLDCIKIKPNLSYSIQSHKFSPYLKVTDHTSLINKANIV